MRRRRARPYRRRMTGVVKVQAPRNRNTRDGHRRAVEEFETAQHRLLSRYGIAAESRFIDVPAIGGKAHVLVTGEGPPLAMVIGATTPAAFWAPLMPQLSAYTLYAMDLPGFGLTDPVQYRTATMRSTAVDFLAQVLDGLGVDRCPFLTHSMGSLWTTWLSLDRPQRVTAQVQVGCPALILGTSAPLPMRMMSIPAAGRLLLKLQPPSVRQVERVFEMVREAVSEIPEIRDVLLACERLPAYSPSMLALMNAVMRVGKARPQIALTGEQLTLLRHPVQLIWGDRDPFGSVDVARRSAGLLPDAELHIIAGGHAPWLNRAEEVGTHARRFLNDHPHR